jgi:RNA polymerase sigma factor (sigma-70 family)
VSLPSPAEMIDGIRKKDRNIIRLIYNTYFPGIERYVLRNSGSRDDASDVFQETMVVLLRTAQKGQDEDIKNLEAFLFSISKYIWLKRLRDRNRHPLLDKPLMMVEESDESEIEEVNEMIDYSLRLGIFQKHFMNMDEDCRKILAMFFEKVPMKVIAETLGLKNEHFARQKKYLCQKTLIEKVRNDPDFLE